MKKGESCGCLDFDLAYAAKTVIKLKNGKWARVLPCPMGGTGRESQGVVEERYIEIERCPWCNRRL